MNVNTAGSQFTIHVYAFYYASQALDSHRDGFVSCGRAGSAWCMRRHLWVTIGGDRDTSFASRRHDGATSCGARHSPIDDRYITQLPRYVVLIKIQSTKHGYR